MPPLDTLLSFAVATAIFAYMPGPAILYTAAQTMARGKAGGLRAALGIHVGGYAHVVAAALGLSLVFQHVPAAYLALKLIGAAYLVWLGIGMIRRPLDMAPLEAPAGKSRNRAFAQSIAVEVLNPKVAVFYIAFLPQFIDPAAALPVAWQFVILGTIVNIAFSSADLVTIAVTDRLVSGLRRAGLGLRIARYAGGGILMALGLRLALDRE